MGSNVDICNRALSEAGARANISALTDPGPMANACNLWYDKLRKKILRMAGWNFAKRQLSLAQLGDYASGTSQWPWQYMYADPEDCVFFRYMLSPPPADTNFITEVNTMFSSPEVMATRRYPFQVSLSPDGTTKVIFTNLYQALGVYTSDVQNVDLFDPLFEEALTYALASKLVIPLSGKVEMKGEFEKIAEGKILEARVADANEGLSKSDHVPDWIAARGMGTGVVCNPEAGMMFQPFDNVQWS